MIFVLSWIWAAFAYTLYRYLRYSDWSTYLQGQIMVAQKACLLILTSVFIVGEITPRYPGEEIVVLVAVILVALAATGMLVALLDAQTRQELVPRKKGRGLVPDSRIEQTKPPVKRG